MVAGTLVLGVLAAALAWLHPLAALAVVPVWVWLIAFFRDPERTIPQEPNVMVSPADGHVSDITELDHVDLLDGPGLRIGIFLSVFNVHLNRCPCGGKVKAVVYKEGKFINAMHHNQASDENESNTLVLADPETDRPVAVVKQIVGLIARRIVCTAKVGDLFERGQRFGMIKFGSRTELYIPRSLAPHAAVKVGQMVHGGKDIIARLGE
jgi:phosphatidylserine decarboxylase